MPKNTPLPEKYQKALSLLADGKLSYREIAIACNINVDEFYGLLEGTNTKSPHVQEKFTEEYERIVKQIDKDIRKLAKSCRKQTLYLLNTFLSKHQDIKKSDHNTVRALTSIANGLSKVTPNIEIGSFSYTKGLSPEDIYAEFKRLSGLASDRGTIQSTSTGGAGEISLPPGSRGAVTQEPEDPILPTEPEA
jgi:hypothetical protein